MIKRSTWTKLLGDRAYPTACRKRKRSLVEVYWGSTSSRESVVQESKPSMWTPMREFQRLRQHEILRCFPTLMVSCRITDKEVILSGRGSPKCKSQFLSRSLRKSLVQVTGKLVSPGLDGSSRATRKEGNQVKKGLHKDDNNSTIIHFSTDALGAIVGMVFASSRNLGSGQEGLHGSLSPSS
eukprot:c42976_g1_i1 orf=343-888(+)